MPTRPTAGSDAKSSRYLRLFLAITLGFGVLHVGSLLAYLYWPQSFYHRHLEYLLDIGYRVKGASLSWQGPEQGDLGRKHLITYSETYDNTVTVDEEGFRSRKVDAATYPVLVSGDSTIYGILLNDQETLPWRLSASLGVPVFNGGRVSLSNLLAHPAIQATEIVIELALDEEDHPFDGLQVRDTRAKFQRVLFAVLTMARAFHHQRAHARFSGQSQRGSGGDRDRHQ